MAHFTPEASAVDSAMAAAISKGDMPDLKKQMRIYYDMHIRAFSAFGSYRDLVDEKLEGGLFQQGAR